MREGGKKPKKVGKKGMWFNTIKTNIQTGVPN